MVWKIYNVLLKESLKWFTNNGGNICKRKWISKVKNVDILNDNSIEKWEWFKGFKI